MHCHLCYRSFTLLYFFVIFNSTSSFESKISIHPNLITPSPGTSCFCLFVKRAHSLLSYFVPFISCSQCFCSERQTTTSEKDLVGALICFQENRTEKQCNGRRMNKRGEEMVANQRTTEANQITGKNYFDE